MNKYKVGNGSIETHQNKDSVDLHKNIAMVILLSCIAWMLAWAVIA